MIKTDKKSNKAAQSLFRTLSKNNYVLEEMIDRKASIIISTNAIIISILLGSSFCQEVTSIVHPSVLLLLLVIWVVSILFALYAIKPFLVTPKELEWHDHNLLTYHAVKDHELEDFKIKIADTVKSEEKIYEAMTEDIFQVGKNIKQKHYFLDFAVYSFLIGILASSITYAMSII